MSPAPAGDTIFALSSGAPPAAIAIVRISGPHAGDAIVALAGPLPPPRRAVLRTLRDRTGAMLDRALLLWFPGPASATGEDLAELHLHGGRAVIAATLAALAGRPGCRAAEPGEFTRRAFHHGRIDLAQAEGLADLLAAETETQRRAALRLVEGGLSGRIAEWSARLLAVAATIEAAIEFAEDEPDAPQELAVEPALAALAEEIEVALGQAPAERLKDGFHIVIAGPPNAGKSSLINTLCGRDVAIVTERAGTTRDLIEAPVAIGDHACILIDSAGLRDADDPAEAIGVSRAEAAIAGADLLLWLGDPADCPSGVRAIRIHARADLPERSATPPDADLALSSRTGEGMADLIRMVGAHLDMLLPPDGDAMLNVRQRAAIEQAARAIRASARLPDPILAAHELHIALAALHAVTGRAGVEDMLDALFGAFCIGK